jgi:hypothetical protein
VEEEEAGEPDAVDQRQLVVEAAACPALVAVEAGVAFGEGAVADTGELRDRGHVAVGEVGVAVAELLGEVELEALGELPRAVDGVAVEREAVVGLGRRQEQALVVAAPLGLAGLERRVVANGDEDVLEAGTLRRVRVGVPGRDGRDAERLREVAQRRVAAGVAALVRALQLDVEAALEGARERGGGVGVADGEPVPGAAGQADEPLVPLVEEREVKCRRQRRLHRLRARVRVRRGQQPAEVRVAGRGLAEQRDV